MRPVWALVFLAWAASGADFGYRAGVGSTAHAKAVVLEDRGGKTAIFAEADFEVTRAVSDVVAARLLSSVEIDRGGLVVAGRGSRAAQPDELVAAIGAAMADLRPARVFWGGGLLSLTAGDGKCIATVFPAAFEGCAGGAPVPSSIRSSFQLVDVTHGLLQRGEIARTYPVQAIMIGRMVTILALGGDVPGGRFAAPGRIVVSFANDAAPLPDDPRVETAIRRALARVR